MASQEQTQKLATRFVNFISNDEGQVLANLYENQAFQILYDPTGSYQSKVRLPRRQLQVFNQFNADTQLFQKVYYHPGLLQQDE